MPSRPNVLFLMSDHTNAQAVAPGSQCLTPNLDRLADEGVRFGRCYTTNAICSPARASLMTATYASTHGMWDCTHTQRPEWVNVAGRLVYWSQLLARAGYRNGYFGKWHVEQTYKLEDFGWHEYVEKECRHARLERIAGTEVAVATEGYRDCILAATGRDDGRPVHHPAYEKGIDFIRRHAGSQSQRPWCCFVSTAEPHDPYIPPKQFLDLYEVAKIRLPPTLHDELAGKPEILRRCQALWKDMTEADWRKVVAAYWAVITFLDSEAGRILDVLRETGQYDNTIIIVTADHGDMMGGHGLVTKGIGMAYEEVYNIPLIVRVPGTTAGGSEALTAGREEADGVVSLVDVGPTLMDLCGCGPLPGAHGRSFRPVLEGNFDASDWQDVYAEFFGQRFMYTQRIVWRGRWKYIFSPCGVDELYDLAADPHETRNLAADPQRRGVLTDMVKRMWRKMEAVGDESLLHSQYSALRLAPIGPESIRQE